MGKQSQPRNDDPPATSYLSTNRVALGLAIYCLLFPFAAELAMRAAPALMPRCASTVLFSRPCPLCGMTRGMAALLRGNFALAMDYNRLVVPAALLLAAELVYRITIVTTARPQAPPGWLPRADLYLHAGLLLAYLAYAAAFALGWT